MKALGRVLASACLILVGACATYPGGSGYPRSDARDVPVSAQDAADAVVEALSSRRVVFIAELHDDVAPISFVAGNLGRFYDAGVRFLVLESGLRALPGSEGYGFLVFYPWTFAGWKYESVELALAVRALNAGLPEDRRLAVVAAEKGFEYPEGGGGAAIPGLLNARDLYAATRVIEALDSADGAKALILYGGAHGSRLPRKGYRRGGSPAFTWRTLGSRLAERYGDGFASYDFRSAAEPPASTTVTTAASNPVIVDARSWPAFARLSGLDASAAKPTRAYDGVVVAPSRDQGRFFQYVPTEANLRYMVERLSELELSRDEWADEPDDRRFGRRGQYLALTYYLKLYFGEAFEFGYGGQGPSLLSALSKLGSRSESLSSLVGVDIPDEASMRKYLGIMAGAGIEKAIAGRNVDLVGLAEAMRKEGEIFPADAWPAYWEAWSLTRAGRRADAAQAWARLFRHPASSCMESLPAAYRLAAECAKALGDAKAAASYESALAAVLELGILSPAMPEF